MTNEEAKEIYVRATRGIDAGDYAGALSLLDGLDAARPNSRHVAYQRTRCYVGLGQPDEAAACCARLEGKIEDGQLTELRRDIEALRQAAAPPPPPEPEEAQDEANVLLVEAVFPVSTEETTVRGHVQSGVFHVGDTVTVMSPAGMPLLAPVLRLGTAEMPLKVVRAGQQAVMLLRVEPNHVATGSTITSVVQEQSYAETMVVDSSGGPDTEDVPAAPQALLEAERMVKAGRLAEAFPVLETRVGGPEETRLAHRLMARVLLDWEERRDTEQALAHARRAFELGGSEDPSVIDVLAAALGANGEADHGLRFLERLYQKTHDPAARTALAGRIGDFRDRHGLGHLWEFADDYGAVIFDSDDIAEIAKAIAGGTIPRNGRCRRDRIGDWRSIENTLAKEHAEVGALYAEDRGGKRSGRLLWVAVLLVALALAAVVGYILYLR